MSEPIIRTHGVSKGYRVLDKPWHRLLEGLGINRAGVPFYALHPTSIDIFRGQSVGIVGRNGSGKSTLLSLIAGILTPTSGSVEQRGRISALLELGSGFNPEFTGRENVFFNGALMGLSRDEIQARFADIAAFAEIGDFMDRPVKTYSSGMFVRLAFATAINVSPDVLIVDEALSVGDIYFQQKCFERLRTMRADGVTLLFVSHDSSAINRFCDRALLVEDGTVIMDADPPTVIRAYESRLIQHRDSIAENAPITPARDGPQIETELALPDVSVETFGIVDEQGHPAPVFISEDNVSLRVDLLFHSDFADPHCGFKIRNRFGEIIFETNSYCMNVFSGPVSAGERITFTYRFRAAFSEGEYTLSLGVADGGHGAGLFRKQLIYSKERSGFKVLRNLDSIQWSGVINVFPECDVHRAMESTTIRH